MLRLDETDPEVEKKTKATEQIEMWSGKFNSALTKNESFQDYLKKGNCKDLFSKLNKFRNINNSFLCKINLLKILLISTYFMKNLETSALFIYCQYARK